MPPTSRSLFLVCGLLLAWLWSFGTAQTPLPLGNLTYRVPPGWSARAENALLVLAPGNLPDGQSVVILLSADVPLTVDLRV